MKFQRVRLASIGVALPEEIVSSSEIEQRLAPLYDRLKLPEGRLELMSGIVEAPSLASRHSAERTEHLFSHSCHRSGWNRSPAQSNADSRKRLSRFFGASHRLESSPRLASARKWLGLRCFLTPAWAS